MIVDFNEQELALIRAALRRYRNEINSENYELLDIIADLRDKVSGLVVGVVKETSQ